MLRVEGADLPPPLEVVPADDLLETQAAYVFGFPLGSSLGRAITLNTSSVSSLRRNNAGVLQRVQVKGGMNPGNSGGPVVDGQGRVVGVAVSGIGRTPIKFAVPSEAVREMLAGRVHEMPPLLGRMIGCVIGRDDPAPIVDHVAAYRLARARMDAVVARPDARVEAARVLLKHGGWGRRRA